METINLGLRFTIGECGMENCLCSEMGERNMNKK